MISFLNFEEDGVLEDSLSGVDHLKMYTFVFVNLFTTYLSTTINFYI